MDQKPLHRKRILILSLQYYPFIGGAEVAIKEITDRLDPSEFEFHLLTLHNDRSLPRKEKVGNVLVHRMGLATKGATIRDLSRMPLKFNKLWYQLRAASVAAHLHKNYSYDGLWAMMAHSAGIPAGTFKAQHPTVPYLLTLQEGDPPEYIERQMRPVWGLFKRAFTSAEYLQAISTFLLAWGNRMGFEGEGIVIPNGVDVRRFSNVDAADMNDVVRAPVKKEGDTLLVTTSRLVRKNGLDDVIRALPLLPDGVSFIIYGIGPDEAVLRLLAQELHVENRVRFMGQLDHARMPSALKACDIFIRPSRSEGMGNSFIEAMAAGLPVIATQEGGIADFLFDTVRNPEVPSTGWAVHVGAPEQIAAAVQTILSNPDDVSKTVRNASQMVSQTYDWDTIAGNMHALFNKMLA